VALAGRILVTVALVIAVLGFIAEAIVGPFVPGALSAMLVVAAGVDYWRFRARPEPSEAAALADRLVFYVAVLALLHGTGLDAIDAWIAGD
jgi:hypothetical protein